MTERKNWEKLRGRARRRRRGEFDLRPYWRVLAYRASAGEPEPIFRARAFASVLANLPAAFEPGERLAGDPRFFFAEKLPEGVGRAEYQAVLAEHQERGQRDFRAGFDHTLAHYPDLLRLGIAGLAARARRERDRRRPGPARDFLESAVITLEAFSGLARRFAREAGRSGRRELAAGLNRIAGAPPRSFHEALQLVWLTHLAFASEGRKHMALGRLDQYLYPFYRRDLRAGRITRPAALDLLCHLWVKLDGFGQVQNICIGGLTPAGRDAVNELSYLCLEATRLVQTPYANLSARFHDATPERFHLACLEVIKTGIGFPAIFNDEVLVPALVRIGIPLPAARDHCFVGCIETMLPGRQPAWSDSRFNLLACFSEALELFGPPPGSSYRKLWRLFESVLRKRLAGHVRSVNEYIERFPAGKFPDPFLSALTRDCLRRGRDVNDGGAVFPRFHGIAGMGLASVADSLAAVRRLVFESGEVSLPALRKALAADFQGGEALRLKLLNRAPKYGNDDSYVDDIAAAVVRLFTSACLEHRLAGGGRFLGLMAANVSNIPAGREVGATPDGRRAGAPLSDAASPYFGRDRRGPTAFIGSVARPDYTGAVGGSVINMKFEPAFFRGPEGTRLLSAFTRSFVARRIQELQFNFTGNELLEAARRDPEKHRNLIVRVSGFSEFFVNLSPEVQADVIRRRAHGG
ncbi:MAG TPA: pyruvate formate lyase family protein [bacterium]|nr:pyruvate formate lyase family protein [bacterium]